MNYFYKELFFNEKSNLHISKRNKVLEHQICMSIFTQTEEQIVVIDLYNEKNNVKDLKDILLKILNIFFKSRVFKDIYVYNYKPTLAGPLTIKFIEDNFGF
jgi:hypothetical protein